MKLNSSFLKIALVVVGLIILAVLPNFISRYYVTLMTRAMIMALFALSFNLLFGYTGLLSFGHAGYFAIGGYTFAYLFKTAGWGVVPAMGAGIVAATLASAVLGYLSVKRGEIYFAMLTLAFGMMIYTIIFQWRDVTNGSDGLTGILLPAIEIGEEKYRIQRDYYYWVSLVALVISGSLLWRITRSHFGEVLQGLRENQERASFSGINVQLHQWQAFVIAGFFAGVAGVFFIPYAYVAAPEISHWTFSAEPVLMTILGGSEVFLGPVVGSFMFVFLESYLTSESSIIAVGLGAIGIENANDYWNLYLGLILLPLILFFRGGLLTYSWQFIRQRWLPEEAPVSKDNPKAESVQAAVTQKTWDTSKLVLETQGISKHFGMVRAVNDVNLKIYEGTITAIIGPNGAGKTTFYNTLSGRFPATEGQIKLNGQDITNLPPYQIAHAGLGRSFQITSVYPRLTVHQNIRIALMSQEKSTHNLWRSVESNEELNAKVHDILELVGMTDRAHVPCSELSYGERALTEIGAVLALDPEVILLDEPTSGMSHDETVHIVNLIGELRNKTGKTILITEHDMEVVFTLAERIIVMHQGRILADDTPEAIQTNPAVREAYLGTSLEDSETKED